MQYGTKSYYPPWTKSELDLIKAHYPDFKYLTAKLPNRTKTAIKHRAGGLGVRKRHQAWSGASIKAVVAAYNAGASYQEILYQFPNRTLSSIKRCISYHGNRRPRRKSETYRFPAVKQIREKCLHNGISLKDLAREIGTHECFGRSVSATSIKAVVNAVEYLGGEIDVVWDQD